MQVLRFDDEDARQEFVTKLDTMVERSGLTVMAEAYITERALKKQAVTKKERSKLLEKFVRVTFSHVRTHKMKRTVVATFSAFLSCSVMTMYRWSPPTQKVIKVPRKGSQIYLLL